ncbi:BLUF domain-containing protein [Sphingomonas montanisoli]|nr:BLUF domain-containing protein [Sphingomonas montanisoli]
MSLISLLYISTSTLSADEASHEVARIVAVSRDFNATADITGALLFTGPHFAQILEGDEAPVAALLEKLHHDPRHRDLRVVQRGPAMMRRCAGWNMAYSGSSTGVASYVMRVLEASNEATRTAAARALANLMVEFVG